MTDKQEQHLREFIPWFIKQPDSEFNQMYFMDGCDTPSCVCGHLNIFCKDNFYRGRASDYIGINQETWNEVYYSFPSVKDDPTDTSLGRLNFQPTKDDAVFMLKHLLKTKGEEVRWQKPT